MQAIDKKYSTVEQAQVGILQYLYNAEPAERLRVGRAVMHEAFGRLAGAAKVLAASEARPDILRLKNEGTCGPQEIVDVIGFDCRPSDGDHALRRYFKTIYGDYFATRARKQDAMSPEDVRVMSAVYESMESSLGFGPVRDVADELSEYQEEFDVNGGKIGVPSPFPQLDAYIRGMETKKTYAVAAFSNTGKSSLFYYWAQFHMRRGKKCLFFSLETASYEVMGNIACAYHNIDWATMLKRGNCHREMPLDRLIVRDDAYDISEIGREIDAHRPDFVFVDFVQNVGDNHGKHATDEARLTAVSREFQRLAKKFKCSIVIASQVNNDSRFKDPLEVTMRGSGALFYTADVILAMAPFGQGVRVALVKNKMGKKGITWDLRSDFARKQFSFGSEISKDSF